MRRLIAALVGALLVLAGAVAPAQAVKPPSVSSITLDQASPALGDWVTFTTSYPKNTKNPRVQVICRQGGVTVWATADHPAAAFLLGGASSDWLTLGGPADCEADLFSVWWSGNQPQQVVFLASTSFTAGG